MDLYEAVTSTSAGCWGCVTVGGVRVVLLLTLKLKIDDYFADCVSGGRIVNMRRKVARESIRDVFKGPSCQHFSNSVRR